MESVEPHRCEKCGQSFTDSGSFASHPCPDKSLSKKQLANYKCSLCNKAFFKPGVLKRHFKSIHSGCEPKVSLFPCTEQGCQFSSTERQEYQAHLVSTHGLTLIPCTHQSCKVSFPTQDDMERHLRGHMPFGCFHCQFVCQNVKDLGGHLLEHKHLQTPAQGDKTAATAACSDQPRASGRPKRKLISNPDNASSLPEDRNEEQPERQRHNVKRVRRVMGRDKPSVGNAALLPSKEYLAEGSEHIFRTHTCPKCRRCFKMRSHLQEHLHLHFPDPSLQCPTCKRYFTSKSKLRIHRLREAGEKVHQCHLCEYSAVEQNAIRRHLVSIHPEEADNNVNSHSYPCPTCGQNFRQSRSLKAHIKTHNILSDSKPLGCFQEGCSFQTSLRKELFRHTAEVHGVKALECRHHACGAIFRSETDMEAHYRTHLAYHCSQCDFSCSNKTIFLQHKRHGHPGSDKLCCDFCSFVTFNPVEFEHHLGHLHANEKIHRCSQCSYVTSHKRGLKRHMLMHSGEKPHKCSLCDFRCRDESYLSKHMLTHSDDKNFMCAECGYVTKWKHYLNVHMRKHAGDLRYQCDQCPYRCHRMDQLNSHKLRHQAKSFMCEVCAYACKRKYELRNHMLAKHSGEDKQPSVYKCKYCTYTTCYRQALQNHENCKHTKLKEFRCALCFYSSFSSISLFLHKKKTHGYVPGDKAWLENYAAKEKERNSTEFLQDFYNMPSTAHGQFEQSTSEGPPPSQREQSDLPGSEYDSASKKADSQTVDSVGVFDVASQEVVNEGISDSSPSVNSPEEYCTLVLTTLSTTDYQTPSVQNEEENCANQTPSTPNLNCNGSDPSQEKAHFSTSSSEQDDVAMADADCEQSDLDDNYEPLTNTSQPFEAEECQTQASEGKNDGGTTDATFPSGQNQPLESELRLKAMKKHDKDQAEAMVLEGRVQMLVVPTKEIYRCDKCCYVTSKETALKYHCQTLCHGRIKEYKCHACGGQFKQKRGLDSHLAKKCPALPRKTRIFVGISNPCLATEDSTVGQEGSTLLDEGTHSDQKELLSSHKRICTDLNDQEFHQQEVEVCTSQLTNCKHVDPNAVTSSESEHELNKIQTKNLLKGKSSKKELLSNNNQRKVPLQSLYTKKDGKFKCKCCNFLSVKLATVERHLSTCRKRDNQIISEENDASGNKSVKEKEGLVEEHNEKSGKASDKPQLFSCPGCSFKCNQKRALDSHEKRGCSKPGDVQCTMCSFVAKTKMSLTRHILYVHNKKKSGVAKPKQLHCQHCTFTCKQERCMTQHLALKHKGARPHHCQYCPFSTTRRYRLEEHESLHTGIGRHSCDMCEKTFGAVTKLRQHKIRIHDKQPTHFCSLCDFSGYTLDDVRRHNLRCHTGVLHHACTHCDAQFSSEVALRNHCKRVHQLQACFSCKQCDYTCSNEVTLKTHQESKHPQVKCTTCQESFKTKESLAIHQRTHLAHQCQLCSFATKTRQLLAQHLLNEHEEGSTKDKPLKCSTCQFACRHQLVLEQHLRSHGGKRLYKCTDCKYSTRNKQKITWHIRIHTGEKPYSCEQCSYTCTDPSRLKLHMRVHQDEKKYLCPQCGYKCKWATQLKYHMTKHTGDKPYACDECDYRTNRADALRAHRDTQHCDMRPYVCEKCGKAFKTSFILKTHQRQHSDDRPYTCGLCQKAFRWPAGLRHHYLSHTKQQPFCCRHCSYRAKQKFQVVKHLQRHHPDMSMEQGVVRDSEAVSLTLKEALEGTLDERAAEVEEEERVADEEVAEEVV
ncbi:zinc finger protein 142 [Larimichthys crocea]|uniref:zinc finger protein 142 n=1 Tax=Larimichthys crocea TaxID=215358 RepID=UPI000622D3C4|nr:zinc finger protein 142 [Larimichthys crocea]